MMTQRGEGGLTGEEILGVLIEWFWIGRERERIDERKKKEGDGMGPGSISKNRKSNNNSAVGNPISWHSMV
jgi:hypothetical protein